MATATLSVDLSPRCRARAMTRSPVPFQPVAIAVETIKFQKRSDNMRFTGIDLESGRRVKIRVQFVDHAPSTVDPLTDVVVLLSLERLTH